MEMESDCEIWLRFKLEDDARVAMDGWRWRELVRDFDNQLRSKIKYGEHEPEQEKIYQEIRDLLYLCINQEGLVLHD